LESSSGLLRQPGGRALDLPHASMRYQSWRYPSRNDFLRGPLWSSTVCEIDTGAREGQKLSKSLWCDRLDALVVG
jgi:hypothetical protein